MVTAAFLINDNGAVLYPFGISSVEKAIRMHFRCRCGHRWYHDGTNRTLKVPKGFRVYDAFDVSALITGSRPAGWPTPDQEEEA